MTRIWSLIASGIIFYFSVDVFFALLIGSLLLEDPAVPIARGRPSSPIGIPPIPIFSPEVEKALVAVPTLRTEIICSDLEDKEEMMLNLLMVEMLAEKSSIALSEYIVRTASEIENVLSFLPKESAGDQRRGTFGTIRHPAIFHIFRRWESPCQNASEATGMYKKILLDLQPFDSNIYHFAIMLQVHFELVIALLSTDNAKVLSPEHVVLKAKALETLEPLSKTIVNLIDGLTSLQGTLDFLKSLDPSVEQNIREIMRGCVIVQRQILLLHVL